MASKVNRELMKGSTSIMVLSLLNGEAMYGYMIVQRLKEMSDNVFELKEGTLYPLLHSLENEGAVEAYWEDSEEGKKRKYYRITSVGKGLLEQKKREWSVYSRAVGKIIGLARIGGGICEG